MSKKTVSSTLRCEWAAKDVVITWNEIKPANRPDSSARTVSGSPSCTGAGTGRCPVKIVAGERDFADCPNLPKG
ncbi:MAG: hypothetical protein ABSG78_16250 [Verrucomicrobiota bacterium]|jgi:hypothetical protein